MKSPAVAAAVLVSSVTGAQTMDTLGFGSRSTALAGAVTADVSDVSANYYNPAGLVRDDALRIGVGYFGTHMGFSIAGQDAGVDSVHGTVLGLVVPIRIVSIPVAFGLGAHLNDKRISRSRSLPRPEPRWEFYDNRPQRDFIALHLAARPLDWLLLGAGLSFLSTVKTKIDVGGELGLITPEEDSNLTHELDGNLGFMRYPQVGLQVLLSERWSVGAVYRGRARLDNELVADASGSITGFGKPIPIEFHLLSVGVNAFIPQQASFGVSYAPSRRWRLGLDVTWVDWSAYLPPLGVSEVELDIALPPGLEGAIEVPEEIAGSQQVPATFRDRVVPRVGAEWLAWQRPGLGLRVRGGYFYENSPIPDQRGETNLIDSDRHALSVGAGVELRGLEPVIEGALNIDLHVHYSLFPERQILKDSPDDAIGDYRADGQLLAAGMTVEIAFE